MRSLVNVLAIVAGLVLTGMLLGSTTPGVRLIGVPLAIAFGAVLVIVAVRVAPALLREIRAS